ncbi:MAG: beta strand repeat-containing protein, partial [Bacteroidota bacterium]
MKSLIIATSIWLCLSINSSAQVFYSKSTGALNTLATWGTNTDGTGTAPTSFTAAGQTFNIQNRATANITAIWTISGTGSNVVVGDGINPVTFSTGTFAITGTFNVSASGTLEVQSNSTFTLGTCATGSTVSYSGNLNQSVRAGTYDNLTLTNGTIARTKTASGAITVNGVLTVNTNNILAMLTNALSGSFTNAGVGTISSTNTTSAFPAAKTWTQTIQYIATAAQTVLGGNYTNLTIGTGAKTATGNVDVSGTLTLTGSLTMGSNSLSGTFLSSGTGNLTTASTLPSGKTWTSATVTYNSGSLQTISAGTYTGLNITGGNRTLQAGTIAISGTFTSGSGTITTTGSTVQFNGTGAQTITITGQTNLVFDNLDVSAGTTKTFSNTAANISVNGTLNIASGASLVLGTNRLSAINTLSGTGTLSTANTTSTPIPASVIWPYNVTFASTGNDQIPAGTYQSLTTSGGGTTTLQADITVLNDLTYNGALSLSTFQLFGVSGTISGTSTLTTLRTGVGDPIPTGKSWTGTVVYSATSNQDIVDAIQYTNLTLSGSATTKSVSNDLTVLATLTITTCTLSMSTFQLIGATAVTSTGTLITQSTSPTPIPSGLTIGGTVLYNASAPQTVVHNTYTNLNLSGSDNRALSDLGDINISGTLTASSGVTLVPNASNVQLTGAAQTINLGAAGSFFNFRAVGTGNKTITAATGTLTVDNELEILSGRTLTMNTNILAGTFTTVGTGTLTVSLASNAISSGITWSFGVNYAGTTQNVIAGNYSTLIIATGTKTATGSLGISSALTMTGTLNMSSNTMSGSFTTSGSGIINTTAATNALPSGITWTCTVNYTGTTQDVMGGNYTILTMAAGAKTATGNLDISTTLTLTGSLNMQSNDLSGTFTQTGTGNLTTAGNLPSGKTWASALVSYNAAGAQTVSNGTYIGLNISGGGDRNLTGTITVSGGFTASTGNIVGGTSELRLTGAAQTIVLGATGAFTDFRCLGTGNKTITAATGSLAVNGELEVLASRTLVMNTNQLIGSLTSITGTGIISTTATSSAIPSGRTWTQTVQYNATVGQELISGTYENLTIGATGTKTAQGNIVVNTALVVTGPLAMGAFDLSGAFTPSGTGAITTAGNLPDGKTWTSATVTYNSAGSQNVAYGTYVALNIAGGSRVLSNGGDINVSGNYTANTLGATYTTT